MSMTKTLFCGLALAALSLTACAAEDDLGGDDLAVSEEALYGGGGNGGDGGGGVCNYENGQTLVVGPVMSSGTVGCATLHYGTPHNSYYTWGTTQTQYLGCANADGSLASWQLYTITGSDAGTSPPSGMTVCN